MILLKRGDQNAGLDYYNLSYYNTDMVMGVLAFILKKGKR